MLAFWAWLLFQVRLRFSPKLLKWVLLSIQIIKQYSRMPFYSFNLIICNNLEFILIKYWSNTLNQTDKHSSKSSSSTQLLLCCNSLYLLGVYSLSLYKWSLDSSDKHYASPLLELTKLITSLPPKNKKKFPLGKFLTSSIIYYNIKPNILCCE